MQPPAVQKLEQPTQLSLAQRQPHGSTANGRTPRSPVILSL